MKHNMNIIQIRGIRGLILTGCAICCLAVGFIGFPGWILMHLWNYAASYANMVPSIGIVQGILLWGIIIGIYLVCRKEKFVVCVKSPEGLSEDELKEVFADLKEQNAQEMIIKSMLKAREAELKLKDKSTDTKITEETVEAADKQIGE